MNNEEMLNERNEDSEGITYKSDKSDVDDSSDDDGDDDDDDDM